MAEDERIFWIEGYEHKAQASFPVKQTQLQQKITTFEQTGFKVVGIGYLGTRDYNVYVINV